MSTPTIGRIPLFNGENYPTWRAQMEGILHKGRHLNIVLGKEKRPTEVDENQTNWDDKDMDARSELLISMEPAIVALVRNYKTSKEIWDFLESSYDRKSIRQKAEEFRNLLNIRMSPTQTMDEFLREFDLIVKRLTELDAKLDDDLVAVLLLDSLDDHYKDVQAAFDAQKDFPSYQTVRIRLMEVGDKRKDCTDSYAMRAKYYKNFNPHRNKANNQKYLVTKNTFSPNASHVNPNYNNNYRNYNCRRCGIRGHKAKFCPQNSTARQADDKCIAEHEQGFIMQEYLHTVPRALEASSDFQNQSAIRWCLDSGATSHMCNDEKAFASLSKGSLGYVKLANDDKIEIRGIGTVKIRSNVNNNFQYCSLFNTLFVPELKENLISINKATISNSAVVFKGDAAKILNKNKDVILEAKRDNGLYIVEEFKEPVLEIGKLESTFKSCDKNSSANDSLELWHNRMGHLNVFSLKQLQRENMVKGLPNFKSLEITCTACIRGKQTRLPFATKQRKSTTKRLELVHTDICGPMKKESLSKSIYFITFIDDFSRKIFVYFMNKKSEALDKFKSFKIMVENETGEKIKRLRSDNGTEYNSKSFKDFCLQNGIKQEFTAEYTPQQNGIAERSNRTLVEMSRCLMIKANLPEYLWAELINTSTYIRNRCPTKLNGAATPEELWTFKKPDVSYFREIGSKAFVLNKSAKNSKFTPRSEEFILIGYSQDAKAYRLWKKGTRLVIKSRDVRFIENQYTKNKGNFYEFNINIQNNDDGSSIENTVKVEGLKFSTKGNSTEGNTNTETENDPVTKAEQRNENKKLEQSEDEDHFSDASPNLPSDASSPRKKRQAANTALKNLKESLKPRRQATSKILNENAMLVKMMDDPKSLKEVEMSEFADEWKKAMEIEWNLLQKNRTWELVNRPSDKNVIGCRWVFKTKYKPDGTVDKRKARLVAKGFSQLYGIDYFETFAPVAEISSIRLLYAIAAEKDLDLHHIDVSTAFLYGDLEEEIYMEQPPYFIDDENKVCRLKRSIYGLKQSGFQWNKKLDSKLREIGFIRSNYDICIYYKITNNSMTYLTVYVDDIVVATNNSHTFEQLKIHLKANFDIKDLGKPKLTVGLEVNRNREVGTISISQTGYIKNLLRSYGLENCKAQSTPLPHKIKLERDPEVEGEKVDQRSYQKLIGSLLHLSTFSRPDISCAVNMLSQFNQDPRKQHMNMALFILRYLKGTLDCKITYSRKNKPICAYVDSNWGEDYNDRKSQSGIAFFLAGAIIDWESRKQKIVTTSSAEAEYITLSSAAKRAAYFKLLLCELKLHCESLPVIMYTDSQSACHIANYRGQRSRTKHLHIRYHYIRETISNGTTELKYLSTDKMLADALTKPTPPSKHYFCFEGLGLELDSRKKSLSVEGEC